MSGLVFVGGRGVQVSYIGAHTANVSATASHTFNSIDLGQTYSNGLLVLGAAATGGVSVLNSVTVGGVPATVDVINNSGGISIGLFSQAAVGGTGNVAVGVTGANASRFWLFVWKLRGVLSASNRDTASSSGTSTSVDVLKNGAGVGLVIDYNVATNFVWTGLTKNDEQVITNTVASGASGAFNADQLPLSVTVSSPAAFDRRIVAASWR